MSRSSLEITLGGNHALLEALASKQARVHQVWVASADEERNEGVRRAREKGIPVKKISREALSRETGTDKHQNVGARASLDVWDSITDWHDEAPKGKTFTVVVMDGIQDPQNLGSLLRSAHFFGADAAVLTKDRAAPITAVVAKASAGALFSLPIIRAVNLARELETLGDLGFWRIGLAADASESLEKMDLANRHTALVVGSEGDGLRTLTVKRCDVIARLSSARFRDSLNAAVAGAVALYEVVRQQRKS